MASANIYSYKRKRNNEQPLKITDSRYILKCHSSQSSIKRAGEHGQMPTLNLGCIMVSSRSGLMQSMCWQLPQEPRAEHVLIATAGASCRACACSYRRSLVQSMCWQLPQGPRAEHVLAATAGASCRACAGSYRRGLVQSMCLQLPQGPRAEHVLAATARASSRACAGSKC